MAMHTSKLVNSLQPSETLAAAAKARELRSKGIDVMEFTVGEPDFITPQHIREAAKTAMDAGHTRYTAATGILELKQAICDAFKRDHGVTWKPSEVTVSNGAKHCLHNVLVACCEPGDEVIIPTPYWVSYSALVELVGAKPVMVETTEQEGFCLSAEKFRKAITPRTRLMMLNSPSNPTGGVYPVKTLAALAEVAVEKNIIILSDEIYDKLIYSGHEFRSFASFGEEVRKRTVIVNGVSKAYAMTGWRIGWTLAPENVSAAINKLQSQQTSNPCSVSQYAALAALTGPQECVAEMRREFAIRRDYVTSRLRSIPGITFAEPGGAFYVFFNISSYYGKSLGGGPAVTNATEFCTALLERAHVAIVSGDAFGAPGYVRLSFAASLEMLTRGLDAIEKFLNSP
ncbi:MAG: pyridoxal phosphate-dependent aminotransferase [Planctomycetaceae bacterium]|nr:pyridoxal phosphate-dependent aminotransferase [Planctomycetaceae bacterium]